MLGARWIGGSAIFAGCLSVLAFGQHVGMRPPLADAVSEAVLPTGILHHPVRLSGELGYVFNDADGTDVLHIVGAFKMTVGEQRDWQIQSQEAIVWTSQQIHGQLSYRLVQVLLWRDALVVEAGGTVTSSPALFLTVGTTGEVTAETDDVALHTSADSRVYEEGNNIRKTVNTAAPGGDVRSSVRLYDVSGLRDPSETPKPRPVITVHAGELRAETTSDGRQVLIGTGGFYLSRGTPGTNDFLDIRADSVVVFRPRAAAPASEGHPAAAGLGTETTRTGARGAADPGNAKPPRDRQMLSGGLTDTEVESAYLEGDVVMSQGPNLVRASHLYYDFLRDRATILDAIVRSTLADRGIPLYLRASEIRQLSRAHYTATDAKLTTSEFHTPHYHVGAARVELSNLTPADPGGGRTGIQAGSFRIRHASLNVGGVPIAYWPFIQGTVDASETAIKSVRTGYSDDFGLEFETDWQLFSLLGYETPDGVDATLSLDYFSARGPGVGVDARYRRDKYFGDLRSYVLTDSEKDYLGREREELSRKELRGRLLLRHRQFLENDWQLTLETSYISDRGFLEEYFESEFDHDKEQETLLHLKKQHDHWAFVATLQGRPLDFTTQTERLPDFSLFLSGEPTPGGGVWYSENRAGFVRFRPAEQSFRQFLHEGRTVGSGSVGRLDSRQEVGIPMDLGPIRFVPFFVARGTVWDDSRSQGGIVRIFGTYGVRGSMYMSRTYPEAVSTLFDLDGVRHIVKSDVTAWMSHTNRDSDELFPFDDVVEEIDEVDGLAFGIRQRWQTKRGEGDTRRTVDFLTFDTELGLLSGASGDDITNGFIAPSRPELSVARNFLNSSLIWRLNDRTALLSEANYDVNDGEIDLLNVSLAVERSPRLSYVVGYRFIEESNSNLLGFDMNYRMTEKHTLALRELFDLARGETLDFTVALIRKYPRWFTALSFALDQAENDLGVSVSIWPEGLPRAALGSKRFTGVSNISRLRNGE